MHVSVALADGNVNRNVKALHTIFTNYAKKKNRTVAVLTLVSFF